MKNVGTTANVHVTDIVMNMVTSVHETETG